MSNQPMPQTMKSPKPVLPPSSLPAPRSSQPSGPPVSQRRDTGRGPLSADIRKREEDRDEVLRESFPASDPPPVTPGADV